MQLFPEIVRLQADPGEQLRAQDGLVSALAAWRDSPAARAVLDAFDRYSRGTPLDELAPLALLFGEDEARTANACVAPLLTAMARELATQPFGIVPLRHHVSDASASLLLASNAETTLTLVAIDGQPLSGQPLARTASFAPAEAWEVVLAGRGSARLIERNEDSIASHPVGLFPGLALGRDAARESLLIDRVEGALLLLRLQRRRETARPRQEFSLDDGRLLRQASATPRESRLEVAVTLLGRMGRKDAAPQLAEIARDERHGDTLRWQALRECIGLDTRTGFWTLTALARAGSDPLAVPAGALRAQLLEAYPELSEAERCPA